MLLPYLNLLSDCVMLGAVTHSGISVKGWVEVVNRTQTKISFLFSHLWTYKHYYICTMFIVFFSIFRTFRTCWHIAHIQHNINTICCMLSLHNRKQNTIYSSVYVVFLVFLQYTKDLYSLHWLYFQNRLIYTTLI